MSRMLTQESHLGLGALERELAVLLANAPPIVCFANDWNGDPTSKHHLMRTFAPHVDVIWVESSGMRRPKLFSRSDRSRMRSKIAGAMTRRASGKTPGDGSLPRLHVASPLSLPLPDNRVAQSVNARLYRRSVRDALHRLSLGSRPLAWVYTPTVAPYLRHIPHRKLVYHCVDRWWAFEEYDSRLMRRHHEQLCRQADVVFASSSRLVEDCSPYAPHAQLVPHGVDWAHFARAACDPPARPADVADITGPIVGFFGLIHDWVDVRLLETLADTLSDVTFVLIGSARVNVERLGSRRNVRLLGRKSYADLPAYAATFDVALIPFVSNELTAAVNPIKLREYLSAGVPVVATDLPEIRRLDDEAFLSVTRARSDFIDAVRFRLAHAPTHEERIGCARRMSEQSWLGRAVEMARQLDAVGALR